MQICGMQKTTLLDYPEHLACIVFLGGCNYRCPFCQNGALVTDVASQPTISPEETLSHLKKRQGILDGICISGGEPTLAPDLKPFIQDIKKLNYKVKLDTNGSRPQVIEDLLKEQLVDYIAMDIKSSLDEYPALCGLDKPDLTSIQSSVTILQSCDISYEFRTTVVKPLHTAESFEKIGEWLNGNSQYYLQSYRDSAGVLVPGLTSYSDDEMKHFQEILLPVMPNTCLRGI